jgi:hypothetical protein
MTSRLLCVLALFAFGCEEAVPTAPNLNVVEVDSSSSQEGWAVNYPKQRKLLFMAGRLWVFYSNGSDMLVRSTTDGVELTAPQTVRQGMVFGHRCMFAFDGSFVHYACCDALAGSDVFYRRGVPRADGSIDWPDDEQVAFDVPDDQSVLYPKVLVDAAGHPWVAFMLFGGGFMVAPENAMAVRSSTTDGTWSTEAGSTLVLTSSDTTESYPDPLGVALASGSTFWVYDHQGSASYFGRSWSPTTGWGPEERITNRHEQYGLFDAVADGDQVHLSFGGGTVRYLLRSASGVWGGESVVGLGSGHSSIASLGGGHALVTWLDVQGDRVLQREMWDGGTGPTLVVIDGGREGLAGTRLGINLNGLSASAGGFMSAVTTTLGAEPPYSIVLATRGE